MRKHLVGSFVLLSLGIALRAWAGFDEGIAAFSRGDYATALREWLPLAQQGDANAQSSLGYMYVMGQGVPQDYALAAMWYRRAADQGDAKAQYNLGVMYHYGQGVPQDYALALTWCRRAADQDHADAQAYLGVRYHNGQGVPQDYAEAMKWYRRAADHGHVEAKRNLGVMYHNGQGVPQDYALALTWNRRAAEQGDARAQFNLGVMYADGEGVPQDYALAFTWYRRAAEQGYADAQTNLGVMYTEGRGVPQDYQRAYFWFSLGAGHSTPGKNHEMMGRNRDIMAARLTPAQLAQAQAQARAWQPHQEHPQVPVEPAPRTAVPLQTAQPTPATKQEEIPLESKGGVYALPVLINGVLTLHFILDTGAAEVNIPADVALTLIRAGTIKDPDDFLPGAAYTLADGTTVKSFRFNLRSLTMGHRHITNVPASIGEVASPLLLGQSFLKRLGMWSMDSQRHVLVLGPPSIRDEPLPTKKASPKNRRNVGR